MPQSDRVMISKHIIFPTLATLMLLTSCFTGVEGTKKITQKDVDKVVKELTDEEVKANSLAVPVDSFANWQAGKRFYVSDDNAKLIFANSDSYNADTLHLKGRELTYSGYYEIGIPEVWDMIYRYFDFVKKNGYFEEKRRQQEKYWMYESINEHLKAHFYNNPVIEEMLAAKQKLVLEAKQSSFMAAADVLNYYFSNK